MTRVPGDTRNRRELLLLLLLLLLSARVYMFTRVS